MVKLDISISKNWQTEVKVMIFRTDWKKVHLTLGNGTSISKTKQ